MLTLTTRAGAMLRGLGEDPCAATLPAPPPVSVDVWPLFTIPTKDWTKEKGWSMKIDYDFKQLFPKLNVCAEDLLVALTTQVTDNRTPAAPSGRCPAGSSERGGYCVDASGKATKIGASTTPVAVRPVAARAGVGGLGADTRTGAQVCHVDRNSPWLGGGRVPRDVGEWMRAAMEHPERLAPYLVKYGYAAESAPVLAKFLVAREGLLRAMWKISKVSYDKLIALRASGIYAGGGEGWTAQYPRLKGTNFVKTYKGLTNPFAPATDSAMFKPVFDSGQWLWSNIKPPFPDDDNYTWALYATFEGGSVFRLSLKRIPRDKGLLEAAYDTVVGALTWVLKTACGLVTHEKLQSIRNTAGMVPEPNTQAVVQGWTAAAEACGMIFPAKVTADCTPVAPPTTVATFWDQHQTKIVAGAVGILGLLVVKQVLARKRA